MKLHTCFAKFVLWNLYLLVVTCLFTSFWSLFWIGLSLGPPFTSQRWFPWLECNMRGIPYVVRLYSILNSWGPFPWHLRKVFAVEIRFKQKQFHVILVLSCIYFGNMISFKYSFMNRYLTLYGSLKTHHHFVMPTLWHNVFLGNTLCDRKLD